MGQSPDLLTHSHLFSSTVHQRFTYPNISPKRVPHVAGYILSFPHFSFLHRHVSFFSWFCKFDFSSFKVQIFVAFSQVRFQLIIIFLIFPVRIQFVPHCFLVQSLFSLVKSTSFPVNFQLIIIFIEFYSWPFHLHTFIPIFLLG